MLLKIMSGTERGDLNMPKVGRNAPCLCGSGKKYKKCCLTLQATAPQKNFDWAVDSEDSFTLESNRVVDLINEGRLDEAERLAEKLRKEYPEHVDGLERLAMVNEARGNREQALSFYQRALEHIADDVGYDEEFRKFYRKKIAQLEKPAMQE
jgi:tetratricopeptide (TPR) repeat protein